MAPDIMAPEAAAPPSASATPAKKTDAAAAAAMAELLDPKAAFIEDVPAYLSSRKLEPEAAILELQERLRRLRALEGQVAARRARTLAKAPEIDAALATVKGLAARRQRDGKGEAGEGQKKEGEEDAAVTYVDYALSDGVFARAALRADASAGPPAVGLWLGAGVMVEYPLQEALALLESNLAAAKEGLEALGRDLDVVKDGATVTEVSIARIFNFDVERRRRLKAAAAAGGAGGAAGAAGAAAAAGGEAKAAVGAAA